MSGTVLTDWRVPCTTSRRRGASVADLVEVAASRCPKFVVFREQMPKNASGKIFKQALREDLIAPEVL